MTAPVLHKYLGRPQIDLTRPTLAWHYNKNLFSKQRVRWGAKLMRLQQGWEKLLLPEGNIVTFSKLIPNYLFTYTFTFY
jgi:uncharacterized protein (DUF3820 family)